MSFDSFSQFLAMGGHGLYVWLCYGTGLLVMLLSCISPILRRKSLIRELAQRQKRDRQTNLSGQPDSSNQVELSDSVNGDARL